jgi:hypothetical protein
MAESYDWCECPSLAVPLWIKSRGRFGGGAEGLLNES